MNQNKSIKGERFVAGLLDSILVGIIAFIPSIIIGFFFGLDDLVSMIMSDIVPSEAVIETEIENFTVIFTIATMVSSTVVGLIYFVWVPFKWNGQTLCKKMMKIKAIDEFGNNPTFKMHLLRAVQNWGAYVGIILLPIIFIDYFTHSLISGGIGSLISLITFVSYVLILARSDGRGLHDLMTNTFVVHESVDMNQEFVEKTTQMGDWAEVDYYGHTEGDKKQPEREKDDWYE